MGTSIPIGACEYYSNTTTTPPAYNNSQTRATSPTSPLLPLANTVRAVHWKLKPRISTLCKQTKLVEPEPVLTLHRSVLQVYRKPKASERRRFPAWAPQATNLHTALALSTLRQLGKDGLILQYNGLQDRAQPYHAEKTLTLNSLINTISAQINLHLSMREMKTPV